MYKLYRVIRLEWASPAEMSEVLNEALEAFDNDTNKDHKSFTNAIVDKGLHTDENDLTLLLSQEVTGE